MTETTDPERIWLEPPPGAPDTGRLWCKDDVWTGDPAYAQDGPPTAYVRADLHEQVIAAMGDAMGAATERFAEIIRLQGEAAALRARVAELEAALRPLAMLYVTSPIHAARRLKTYVRVSEDGCGAKVDPADILNAAATLWEYPKVESDIVEDEEARRALGDGHG